MPKMMKKKARVRRVTRKPANVGFLATGVAGVTAQLAGATAMGAGAYYGTKANKKHKETVKKMNQIQKKQKPN